jgi:hypothetical protein
MVIYEDPDPTSEPPAPGPPADVRLIDGSVPDVAGTLATVGSSSTPLWLGTDDDADTLIVRINGGPPTRVYARADDRLNGLDARMTSAETALASKQPSDADLTVIAALAPADGDVVQRTSGAWANRTPAQVKTSLSLVKGDVGLGSADDTSDIGKPISTAQQTALDGKLSAGSNLADVANAATARTNLGLGTAATTNTGIGSSNAILGNDARLSDSRTPVAHVASHATAGTDPVSPAAIGAATSGALTSGLAGKTDIGHGHTSADVAGLPVALAAVINVRSYGATGNGATDDFQAIQDAINAAAGNGKVFLPAGTYYLNKAAAGGLRLPAGAAGLVVEGAGRGATVIRLSRNVPRAFDCWWTSDGHVFRNIAIRNLSVDANSVDGAAVANPTAVQAPVTLAAGSWTAVNVGSNAGFLNGGIVYFAPGNVGTAKAMVIAARLTSGSSTSIDVRNDAGSSLTLAVGDIVQGATRDHVVFGSYYNGGASPNWNMSFDQITVENVAAYNIPTDQTGMTLTTAGPTVRSVVRIATSNNPSNIPASPLTITNVALRDIDATGGAEGFFVGFPGQSFAGFWDNIVFERCRHTTTSAPTKNYASLNFLIGGGAPGRYCAVRGCWGEYSGDVGVEIDNAIEAEVVDTAIDDAYGGAFFSTNYAAPAATSAGAPSTTLSAGITTGSSSLTVPAIPATVSRVGWLLIDSELMYYVATSATALSVYRAINGTVAASHSSGATVRFLEVHRQRIAHTRCTARRTRIGVGRGFYQLRAYPQVPQPPLVLRDCTYTRIGTPLAVSGEALYVEGKAPRTDVAGLTVRIDGINYTTLDNTTGSAISFRATGARNDGFANVHPEVVRLRDVDLHVTGTLASGSNAPKYVGIHLQEGYWEIDWRGIQETFHFVNAFGAATTGISLFGNPANVVRGIIQDWRLHSVAGDGAPTPLTIPSTAFGTVQWLRVQDLDLTNLMFGASAGNTNYKVATIDSTNAPAVHIDSVRHPAAITGGYGGRLRHRVTAGSSYTATAYDEYVGVTSTANPVTVTLPAAAGGNSAGAGSELTVHDESGAAGTNAITVAAADTELIDGSASKAIAANYGTVRLLNTGTGWTVL